MNVNLLSMDPSYRLPENMPWNTEELEKDLDLATIYNAMAGKDRYVFDVCRRAILNTLTDRDTIVYRQRVLQDALDNPDIVWDIYSIIVDSVAQAKRLLFWVSRQNPEFVLHESISVLQICLAAIEKIREIGRKALPSLHSEGFIRFFSMISHEFDEDYVKMVSGHLENLRFPRGIYVSGGLGRGNALTGYNLVVPKVKPDRIVERITNIREPHYTYVLPDRDEQGGQALGEMRARSISETARIVSESAENVLGFIDRLKEEIAFYLGCLNLKKHLNPLGARTSFPVPGKEAGSGTFYEGIYDLALSLRTDHTLVGNSLYAEKDHLIFITGANKGGKSTLLKAIGQAQLMMQSGMFVAADSFSTFIAVGLFTHFKREEDTEMSKGKFDEELSRMSGIVDHIIPGSRLLFNESFSSTNVREGSEIAESIIDALLTRGIRIIFVTHFNELAEAYLDRLPKPTFLKAERLEDGTRTFRILQADPISTSFGYDIFQKVFKDWTDVGVYSSEKTVSRMN
jgi:DNA mismatch repair ATPase MutS